ncbi:hypothetical protein NMY22_g10369 [Coprinellus aureogranulatus]|nr:hypothetical protein NMY22_g10369 [Coprinellus aureogranulatus]
MPIFSQPPSAGNHLLPLIAFPAELIDLIIEHVKALNDFTLKDLALTCQALLAICRPHIFHMIYLVEEERRVYGLDYSALIEALDRDPLVRTSVQDLAVAMSEIYGRPSFVDEKMISILGKLEGVKRLGVSSVFFLNRLEAFEEEPLISLRPILQLQTLVSLEISNVSFPTSMLMLCPQLKEWGVVAGSIHCVPELEILSIHDLIEGYDWPQTTNNTQEMTFVFPDLRKLKHLQIGFHPSSTMLTRVLQAPNELESLQLCPSRFGTLGPGHNPQTDMYSRQQFSQDIDQLLGENSGFNTHLKHFTMTMDMDKDGQIEGVMHAVLCLSGGHRSPAALAALQSISFTALLSDPEIFQSHCLEDDFIPVFDLYYGPTVFEEGFEERVVRRAQQKGTKRQEVVSQVKRVTGIDLTVVYEGVNDELEGALGW